MREKVKITFSDATTTTKYIVPGSFTQTAMSYCFVLEDTSIIWLQRLQIRMLVISQEE